MPRFLGYEYEVKVYAFLKVAMAKTENEEEIDEIAFDSTCRLYEHETDIDVIDNKVIEIEQSQKYFTVANVGLELTINVTAYSNAEAYLEAENMARDVGLPAGVAFFACEAVDAERGQEVVDWDWAVGE